MKDRFNGIVLKIKNIFQKIGKLYITQIMA
jgi:hypothetical protein